MAIWASSPPDFDGLPVEICSLALELHLSQFSYLCIYLQILYKRIFELKTKQKWLENQLKWLFLAIFAWFSMQMIDHSAARNKRFANPVTTSSSK
jgi:predicted nucleotide-binding protein (sugar kinase/HSP70/actin superfamily)